MTTATGGPLRGVTILDTTNMLMGPYATLVLAQFGARVVKVEPLDGDIARRINDVTGQQAGPIHLNANRGKESVALDLRDAADRALFDRMVATADVVAHNRPPGSDVRLGLDYATLSATNPRIIVCGMHGYGSTGPYGPLPAYDDAMQAISGLAAAQSWGSEPQYVRSPVTDKITALMAASAIAAALYERRESGVGQYVEVPMLETIVQFLMIEQQCGYVFDPPRGPIGYPRSLSPYRRPMRTADGLIGLLPSTDAQWHGVFDVLDAGELATDPRFATVEARSEHIDELYAWLAAELAIRATDALLAGFLERRVPAMRVNSMEDLFTDPHLTATGYFQATEHPDLGRLRHAAPPVRFSRSGTVAGGPAPRLDQDRDRVEAGLPVPPG
ncbi:CoA transferase [Nocardioides carbamazepini]|uniref:CaiB/BaiF CoA transferase family protein n=1 Tax=Nocardioides carbamazepini TaxID=2854259 RepID=UPI00214A7229|nr:CoA transferase [Nocardioides carbamazepini]MCR1785060.1 CoA transferase [Nocardioides carbamazepini]